MPARQLERAFIGLGPGIAEEDDVAEGEGDEALRQGLLAGKSKRLGRCQCNSATSSPRSPAARRSGKYRDENRSPLVGSASLLRRNVPEAYHEQ
jgi:hypothetical protein